MHAGKAPLVSKPRPVVRAALSAPPGFRAAGSRMHTPTGCACGGGCPRCQAAPVAVQRQPAVSQPGDRFEREADEVADRVMRMAQPGAVGAAAPVLQRRCAQCEDEADDPIRRAAAADGTAGLDTATASQVAGQGGVPLPQALRGFFEPRFGQDLGSVRVHTGTEAEHGARAVQARAYTLGRDIVFGAGQYAPHTDSGKRLLAHELTHVLQQSGGATGTVQRTSATIMREESCEERCERNFNESSGEPMSRIAQRSYCLQQCRPPEREPERKPAPKPDPKPQPAACKPGDEPVACEAPSGTPVQPAKVSNALVGRWMGKFVKVDKDPGEGCIERPYVAAAGEKVCTIGYGIQLPNCPVVSKATGGEPTKEERFPKKPETPEEKKNFKPGLENLRCDCPGQKSVDCKGPEAENLLRSRAVNGEKEVHDKVPVSLDAAQFDALVDLVMHHGSMPPDLLTAIKTYWCTDAGKDHVRALYLKSMLNPQGSNTPSQGFIDRRRRRVWPPACKP